MAFFDSDQIDSLSGKTVRIDVLVRFDFVSETMYAWNGDYNLIIDGNTYHPMHGLMKIDGLGVSSSAESQAVTLSMNGVDSDLLALCIEQTPEANQQLITLYVQLFDEDWQLVGTPVPVWWGFMQPPRIDRSAMSGIDGSQQLIKISAENAFFNRSRPPYGRYSDRDQKKRSPTDKFFQFATSLANATFNYPDY